MSQFYKHDCVSGEHKPIYPDTTIDRVTDVAGKPLSKILSEFNHIYVPYVNNSRRDTRLQVPVAMRRRGLWLTYETNVGVVTEIYASTLTDISSWTNPNNWVSYLNENVIKAKINEVISWYKA